MLPKVPIIPPLDEDQLARLYVNELFGKLGVAILSEDEQDEEREEARAEATPTSSVEREWIDADVAKVATHCFERMLEVQSQTENYTEQSEIYGNDEAVATLCTEYVKKALLLQRQTMTSLASSHHEGEEAEAP